MHVIWESFIDVEELSNAEHSTGIASYEVGIGRCAPFLFLFPRKTVLVLYHTITIINSQEEDFREQSGK